MHTVQRVFGCLGPPAAVGRLPGAVRADWRARRWELGRPAPLCRLSAPAAHHPALRSSVVNTSAGSTRPAVVPWPKPRFDRDQHCSTDESRGGVCRLSEHLAAEALSKRLARIDEDAGGIG